MAALAKKMSKYKKGSKEFKAAMLKLRLMKKKLKHAHGKVVKKVVKKGGKRAKKYAKKEKKKARKMARKLSRSEKAMAAMAKKMSKYKKGSKEFKAAMLKLKMLKWKMKHTHRKVVKKVVKK